MNTKQEIREFLTTLANKAIPIQDDDSLLAARLIDSLKVAELIVYLEDRFQVSFDGDDLIPDNLDSLNAIIQLLVRKGVQQKL